MKTELPKVKKSNPSLSHKEAFKVAAQNVSRCQSNSCVYAVVWILREPKEQEVSLVAAAVHRLLLSVQ